METSILLSLVIPCYNEEKTLADTVKKCLTLKDEGISLEIIIVDDCSIDNSFSIAKELSQNHKEIRVVRHEKNKGKGAALRTGFVTACGKYIGIQDADAEYNPLDYIAMMEPLQQGKADVVYGSRYLRPDTRRVLYFWHTWMNRKLTFVSNMFTNLDITDMETCYKLFRNDVIKTILPMLKEDRFGFEPEVTCSVSRLKYRVYECAIHYEPRTYEEGKKIGWRDGVHALYCILHYGAPDAPIPMQILLYFFIGTICAVANICIFAILIHACIYIQLSTVIAFIIAAFLNYLLCLAILFRHKSRWSAKGEVFSYIVIIFVMGLLDYFLTFILIQLGLMPVLSKTISAIIGFAGNFIFRKFIVF